MAIAIVATTKSGSTMRKGTRKINRTSGAGRRSINVAKARLKRAQGTNPAIRRPMADNPSQTHATAKKTIASDKRTALLNLKCFIPKKFRRIRATSIEQSRSRDHAGQTGQAQGMSRRTKAINRLLTLTPVYAGGSRRGKGPVSLLNLALTLRRLGRRRAGRVRSDFMFVNKASGSWTLALSLALGLTLG